MRKLFRIIGVILLIIIIVPLIMALFVKKEYSVERSIVINLPVDTVFDFVVMLKNQDKFSYWATIDPDMRQEFRGTDGTVGFVSAWDSDDKNAGKGEQEITGIIPGERIDYEIRFFKPFKAVSSSYLITKEIDGVSTNVIWEMSGRMNYPSNLFLLSMDMENSIGSDLDTGLKNLKELLETRNQNGF